MPTKASKQYKIVQRVREAVEAHGATIHPEVKQLENDWRSWTPRYRLSLLDESGKDVLKAKGSGISLAVLNQGLGAFASTIRSTTRRK